MKKLLVILGFVFGLENSYASEYCLYRFDLDSCITFTEASADFCNNATYVYYNPNEGLAKLCNSINFYLNTAAKAGVDLGNCSAALNAETARADANYEAGLYQFNLAKRLRRACGARCRRIK